MGMLIFIGLGFVNEHNETVFFIYYSVTVMVTKQVIGRCVNG